MSQVFAADGVNKSTATTLVTTSGTQAVLGNFVNPPFANAKAMVFGYLNVTAGTGTTSMSVTVYRNPNAEALIVTSVTATVTAGNTYTLSVQAADAIPDGRPCQYQIWVQQTAATGNGSIVWANISVLLISG